MFRALAIISSAFTIATAYYHSMLGGLIIGIQKDGTRWFSNDLMSSGGDASDILLLGFYSFIITFLWYMFKKNPRRTIYYANLLFCYFILFLVNLNVSIMDSIRYGDHALLATLLFMHMPMLYDVAIKVRGREEQRAAY